MYVSEFAWPQKIIFTVKIVQHSVQSSVQHKRALISLEAENPNKPKKLNPREIWQAERLRTILIHWNLSLSL